MLAAAVKTALEQARHVVDRVETGEDALAAIEAGGHEAVILDISLPGISGLEVLASMRRKGNAMPVLVLTARDTPRQRVEGLDAGADDYLVKPFDLDELLARLRAITRRRDGRAAPIIRHGPLTLDPAGRTAALNEAPLQLSVKEFDVLALLIENAGRVMSRQQIEDRLYGWDEEPESNTIEAHISRLRKKLGMELIRTIRGLGYIVEKHA